MELRHLRSFVAVAEAPDVLLGIPAVPGELLHSATVAIAGQVPMAVLEHAVPSFPTVSEVWLRLLEACRA